MAEYDIPSYVKLGQHSKSFEQFLHNWFEDSFGLSRHEVDLDFLGKLTPSEHQLAVDLLRRNLHLGYSHIVEGIALLEDQDSVPVLRKMLESSLDLSRKLTLAGSLWKLVRDPSFPEVVELLVRNGSATAKQAHFEQILWLGNMQAIEYLIQLLTDSDSFVTFLALNRLNEIDGNKRYFLARDQFPRQAAYFLQRKDDELFIDEMVKKLNSYAPTHTIVGTTGGLVIEPLITKCNKA